MNFKDRWNVWVWKRLVWVSSWEGVDVWWFISIVSFSRLRNTWGISEAWLWVCPKRINSRGTTCPECRCHPSDGLGKGESQPSPSIHLFLLPGCEHSVTSHFTFLSPNLPCQRESVPLQTTCQRQSFLPWAASCWVLVMAMSLD